MSERPWNDLPLERYERYERYRRYGGGADVERMSRAQARAASWLAEAQARSARVNPYVVDSLLALLSAGVSVWAVYHDDGHWPWWIYLLALSTALPLPWRRRFPGSTLLLCTVPSVVLSVVAHSTMPQVPVYAVLCIYTVAEQGRDWLRWLTLAAVVTGNIVGTHGTNGMLFSLLTSIGPFIVGSVVRDVRRLARVETERAHRLGLQAASEAARAVAEERSRIAREMHDILAHAVSLMVIQAEAGPLVVHSNPERAVKAFDTIADSGRDAMVQLRRVLGVLKEEGTGPQLAPQPTLAELPAVAERVRQSGVHVDLRLAGPEPMPADVQAAAFRIVQEALTNIVKHSGADYAAVRVAREGDSLEIAVSDNGKGPDGSSESVSGWSGGRGLLGIRERAAACGGTATAGPGPEGRGFLVTARLPLAAGT